MFTIHCKKFWRGDPSGRGSTTKHIFKYSIHFSISKVGRYGLWSMQIGTWKYVSLRGIFRFWSLMHVLLTFWLAHGHIATASIATRLPSVWWPKRSHLSRLWAPSHNIRIVVTCGRKFASPSKIHEAKSCPPDVISEVWTRDESLVKNTPSQQQLYVDICGLVDTFVGGAKNMQKMLSRYFSVKRGLEIK